VFGPIMVFIVVAVYLAVVGMFAAFLMPKLFVKLPLTIENVELGLLACLLITLCIWLILIP